ncbi:MAG: hypothetical protein JWR80_545 [Bradyrhizobium sp.]|nr:hypothetical protein [Bradyrhizobium sp.]
MICGLFTTTDRGLTGEIRFFGAREQVELRRVEKESDKAPDYRILAVDDPRIDYGAAWCKTSKEGRDYLSLKLDSGLFPAPIYPRLYETDVAGEHELVLQR